MANVLSRAARYLVSLTVVASAVWVMTCGSQQQMTLPQMAQVTVDAAVVGGNQAKGTATLNGNAPGGGAVVGLSSDSSSAAVPPNVTIPAGTQSANFTITTTAVTTATPATITGSYNNSSAKGTLQVNPGPLPQLSQLTVDTSVIGGNPANGTAVLNGNAPAGGAVVTLASDNASAVVPASVTIPASNTSANFTVTTKAVAAAINATITGMYNNSNAKGSLLVNPAPPPGLVAKFTVTSASKGSDACALQPDATLDCDFDGSSSTGSIKTYIWNYVVGNKNPPAESSSSPKYRPNPGCGFFGGLTQNGALTYVMMPVTLRVADAAGNQSDKLTNNNVRLFPQKNCGNGF